MNFVLDSSLAAAFILEDEATSQTDRALDSLGRGARAVVPALWYWEMANLLLMAERRKRITQADGLRFLAQLNLLPIDLDEYATERAFSIASELARQYKLTVYDAAYLELAIRRKLALGSLDLGLRKAAKSAQVSILPQA